MTTKKQRILVGHSALKMKEDLRIKDVIKDGMIVIICSSCDNPKFNSKVLGRFKYISGEIIPLDYDDYSLEERIERFDVDLEQNILIVYKRVENLATDDFMARINFYKRLENGTKETEQDES